MKIVINNCYGGFGLSKDFLAKYPQFYLGDGERDNEKFLTALEDFGVDKASDDFAKLKIVEIPDTVTDWEIDEYDGMETIIYVFNGKIHRAY